VRQKPGPAEAAPAASVINRIRPLRAITQPIALHRVGGCQPGQCGLGFSAMTATGHAPFEISPVSATAVGAAGYGKRVGIQLPGSRLALGLIHGLDQPR
jgi:hypothetical protein